MLYRKVEQKQWKIISHYDHTILMKGTIALLFGIAFALIMQVLVA